MVSPNYSFEPVRVDISSKSGKIRARKVNHTMSPNVVKRVPYPLCFKTNETAQFFENRKSYSEIIKNPDPEVLFLLATTLLGIILLILLMVSGIPEELQLQSPISAVSFPSIEEIITTILSGGSLKQLFADYFEQVKKSHRTTVDATDKTHSKRRKKKLPKQSARKHRH